MKVTPLFSTPLLHTHIGKIDPITLEWIKRLDYPDQSVAVVPGDQTPQINRGFNMLNHPKLKNIKESIWNVAEHFVYEVLDVKKEHKFKFTTSWVNRVRKGEYLDPHTHPNSLLSGVYYLDVADTSAPITFRKNIQHLNLFSDAIRPNFNENNFNQFNTDKVTVYPVSGDILMFPSHLLHSVDTSDDVNDRYSLAFNVFCDGFLGIGTEQITI